MRCRYADPPFNTRGCMQTATTIVHDRTECIALCPVCAEWRMYFYPCLSGHDAGCKEASKARATEITKTTRAA